MKKILILLVFLFVNMITIFSFNINVFASETVYKSLFVGTNDESVDLKTSVKITDNSLNYVTNITFIVHGIDSSASAWSNNLGTQYGKTLATASGSFGYNPNSIIECLRRRCDANVYLIESHPNADSIFDENDSYINRGFYLKKLIVNKSTSDYYSTNEYYVEEIDDASKHIVIVYDASWEEVNSAVVNDTYKELEYVINKITYNVIELTGSKVKINLIGHSRGGVLNMMYATDYPYNVDGLFSIGTPYIGTSIAPLNDLVGDAFNLADLIESPGGTEIVNKGYTSTLKENWQNMYEDYEPNINFHAIAGSSDITHLTNLILDAYNGTYVDESLKTTLLQVLNILIILEQSYIETHDVYAYEKVDIKDEELYNSWIGLLFVLVTQLTDTGLSAELITAIATLLYEIYYSYETNSFFIKTDLFVDTHSQLAQNFEFDSNDNELNIPIKRYEKIFTSQNCEFYDVSHNAPSIVHNNEARDLEIINYILSNITLSGNDNYTNTCYLKDGELAIMWKKIDSSNRLVINSAISFRLYDDNVVENVTIEGISRYFNNNYNENSLKYLEIGPRIKIIEEGALDDHNELISINANNNNNYVVNDNILYSKYLNNFLIVVKACNAAGHTSITLPENTLIINSAAFKDNKTLTSINLSNVRIIYEDAFYNASSLNSIIGTDVSLVYDYAFFNTSWFNNLNTTTKLGNVLIKYIGTDEKLFIEDCTCIYSHAIYNNSTLQEVICGAELTYLNTSAFVNNENLTNVYLFSPTINIGNPYSIVTDSTDNITVNCHFVNNGESGFTNYGGLRNCCNMIIMDELYMDCCSTSNTKNINISNGNYELIRFNIDCAKSYKFTVSGNSKIILELYDNQMNLISSNSDLSYDELTTKLQKYVNKGIYYLKIYFENADASGDITLTYQCTWPTATQNISLGDNNILTHLHKNLDADFINKLYLQNVNGEGFYKFTITGYDKNNNLVTLPSSSIKIYRSGTTDEIINCYSMIDNSVFAENSENMNSLIVYLYDYLGFYIDICLPTNEYNSLTLNIQKVTENNIDLFELTESQDQNILNLSGISFGDNLQKMVLKQAGRFELDTNGFSQGQFVVLKVRAIVDDTMVFAEPILYDLSLNNQYEFDMLEGTYYVGYIGADLNVNLSCLLTRKVTIYGASYLDPDPNFVGVNGSEVTLNGGLKYSNEITQGFTRVIYLTTGESRLDYYWYSSDENVARITDFGTVVGLNVNNDTSVKIMAVNIEDPSKVFVKEFIIKKDTKTFDSDPIERYGEIIIDTDVSNEAQIDLSELNVPINWLQYFIWSSSDSDLYVDQFGRIFADEETIGNTYTITGTYKLNSRVKVYITVKVE